MEKVNLLIIDPQVDFCDPNGALYVKGAEKDMQRLADMIRKNKDKIGDIMVSLDMHHLVDIAHPAYWVDVNGNHPDPEAHTIITLDDVVQGVWKASNPDKQYWALNYVIALNKGGKYPLCIWKPHCLIGTIGATVHPELMSALLEWEELGNIVSYIEKGTNPDTEHYSAVKPEVEDPDDASTWVANSDVMLFTESSSKLLVAGEASSHCVANTVKDIITYSESSAQTKNIVLLTDAMSPVPTFESLEKKFIDSVKEFGVSTSTTDQVFA